MDSHRLLLGLGAALTFSTATHSATGQIVGITWGGQVVHIDAATGAGSVIGSSGLTEVNSMSRSRRGALVVAAKTITAKLYSIDPDTGQSKLVALPYVNDIRGLAFASGPMLYAAAAQSPAESLLYRLDLSMPFGDSGIKATIGNTTMGGIQALTFSPEGILYGWSAVNGLITIDPFTAECSDVNTELDGSSIIQTLAFGPDGTLYGAYDKLYKIDLQTGALTLVGGGSWSDVRGMEFVAGAFEEETSSGNPTHDSHATTTLGSKAVPGAMIGAKPRLRREAATGKRRARHPPVR